MDLKPLRTVFSLDGAIGSPSQVSALGSGGQTGDSVAAHLEIWNSAGPDFVLLNSGTLSVGRTEENDVALSDENVSRLHAVFESRAGGWCLRDLSSRNGTFVNGERIFGERALRHRDEIRVGTNRLLYRQDSRADRYTDTCEQEPAPELTRRERDVLVALFHSAGSSEMFVEPASTRKIAEILCVTEAAVKQHLSHLYDKFDIRVDDGERRRFRLANEALRRGAVRMSDVRRSVG